MTIHRRIVYGYALVLGLALVGTTTGLLVGNHYQRRAFILNQAVEAERKLLSDLQVRILYNLPAKQLAPSLNDAERFQLESQRMLDRIIAIKAILQQHRAIYGVTAERQAHIEAHEETHPTSPGDQGSPRQNIEPQPVPVVDYSELHQKFSEYEATVDRFQQRTETFVQEVNALSNTPEDLALAQQKLLVFVQSPDFEAFVKFPDHLEPFVAQVNRREKAAKTALHRAETLRTQIILGSLLLSGAIATLTALYTSQAIAQPILGVIHVARRVTEENNFDLQAPVGGDDEVGILANALNQLIQQVKQLLTQLGQKNKDLEAAFTQLGQQQMHLVQTEKMSSLGQLVAGVAHEINNPVNFIHGNLVHVKNHLDEIMTVMQQLQQRYPEAIAEIEADLDDLDLTFIQSDLVKILGSMRVGTDRIRQIVLSLRNFSRLDEAEYKAVDLHEGLESSLMILQHRLKASPSRPAITVVCDYGELAQVECYPGQLNQVVMNILANAIDAIEERYAKADDKAQVPLEINIRTANYGSDWVEIAIADTGVGMTEDVREKIFTPFFTTKPENIGTGLGMSISYQIITETHQGKLACNSIPGSGTEFFIRIPCSQKTEDRRQKTEV